MGILTATIAAGASLSGEVDVGGRSIVALWTPGGWETAAITFQALNPDGTYGDLFDSMVGEVSIASGSIPAAAANVPRRFALPPLAFEKVTRIKVRSGVSGTAVNQTAARTIYIVTREFA